MLLEPLESSLGHQYVSDIISTLPSSLGPSFLAWTAVISIFDTVMHTILIFNLIEMTQQWNAVHHMRHDQHNKAMHTKTEFKTPGQAYFLIFIL